MGGRIVKKLRESGVRGTAAAVFARLRKAIWSEEVFIVARKDLDRVLVSKRPTGVLVEPLGRGHLPLLARLNRERDAAVVDERFVAYLDAGFKGYVAQLDGAAVGYYWWVDATRAAEFPDLRELGLGIELGPGEAYGSDFYLLEAHRNGRLAGEILGKIETDLHARGFAWLWGYFVASNRPARWMHESRGYERCWTHTRKRRFFTTRVEDSPNPSTYKGGPDGDG